MYIALFQRTDIWEIMVNMNCDMIQSYRKIMNKTEKLNKSIDRLATRIRNSNNLGLVFLRGIIGSVGTIVGLAILAMIVLYLIGRFSESSIIGKFLNLIANLTTKK